MLSTIIHSGAFKGALAGFVSAISVDIHVFITWTDWSAATKYNWGTATFRWFIGIVTGALTGAGYGALLG